MRTALFWAITQHIVLMPYRRFGTTNRSPKVGKKLPLHAVAHWLRRCATNRKVAGSIPDGVIGIFH